MDYLSDKRGKRVTDYFGAVSYFETHVAHLNLARWLAMRISRYPDRGDLYSEGSDCFDKRLQEIHNQAKHLHDKITEGLLPKGHTVSMWLTNTGLESVGYWLPFVHFFTSWMIDVEAICPADPQERALSGVKLL